MGAAGRYFVILAYNVESAPQSAKAVKGKLGEEISSPREKKKKK